MKNRLKRVGVEAERPVGRLMQRSRQKVMAVGTKVEVVRSQWILDMF